MRILVVEDDADMRKIVKLYLTREGYQVVTAEDGQEGFDLLCSEQFDLTILDWMMPKMDGITLCRAIRQHQIPVKVIMLTAKWEAKSEITGLRDGADDYIKKPFEPKILLLRIKKLFHLEELLVCGDISLNQQSQVVKKGSMELKMTRKEYELLSLLLLNKGIILTREQILDRVWGMDYQGEERTVDTHIRRLRHKIGDDSIVTHVGLGYTMEEPHE